jgi:hypothetical protein
VFIEEPVDHWYRCAYARTGIVGHPPQQGADSRKPGEVIMSGSSVLLQYSTRILLEYQLDLSTRTAVAACQRH